MEFRGDSKLTIDMLRWWDREPAELHEDERCLLVRVDIGVGRMTCGLTEPLETSIGLSGFLGVSWAVIAD